MKLSRRILVWLAFIIFLTQGWAYAGNPQMTSAGSTFNRGDFTTTNAFFWSSLDLSSFHGTDAGSTPHYIELLDVAGKKATGYLGAVGAGETLGSETITGWTNFGPPYDFETLTSVGGDITSAIESTGVGVTYSNQTAYAALALFKIVNNMTINSGNLPVLYFGYGNPNVQEPPTLIAVGAQSAGENIYYYVNPSTYSIIQYNSSNPSIFSCTNSIKRVSDPPATAIHIVSSLNGTTRNWVSIESGFDPNTIASWIIYSSTPMTRIGGSKGPINSGMINSGVIDSGIIR